MRRAPVGEAWRWGHLHRYLELSPCGALPALGFASMLWSLVGAGLFILRRKLRRDSGFFRLDFTGNTSFKNRVGRRSPKKPIDQPIDRAA